MTRDSFVQTLVLTDIATGWTECAPLLFRDQTLVRAVLGGLRELVPFDLLGLDTDNDSVFMNETVRCRDAGIVFTRCRLSMTVENCTYSMKSAFGGRSGRATPHGVRNDAAPGTP